MKIINQFILMLAFVLPHSFAAADTHDDMTMDVIEHSDVERYENEIELPHFDNDDDHKDGKDDDHIDKGDEKDDSSDDSKEDSSEDSKEDSSEDSKEDSSEDSKEDSSDESDDSDS